MLSAPTFYVVPGSTVKRVIDDNKKQVFDVVEAAYRLHGSGNTLIRTATSSDIQIDPSARIIALPGHVGAVQKRAASNGYRVSRETGPATSCGFSRRDCKTVPHYRWKVA